jgi:small subunit ribosomal protein S20
MANRRSSIKKIRVDKRRVERNLRVRTALKSVVRRINELLQKKNSADLRKNTPALYSELDKAVKKGIIHRNRASRVKSRISLKINALASAK